jgi:hypothetical protein
VVRSERGSLASRAAVAIAACLVVVSALGCVNDDIPARPTGSNSTDYVAPGLEQLASSPGCGSINLVVTNGTLYWTEKATGTVRSVSVLGGPTRTIATAQRAPGPIAVDATTIYWVETGSKSIVSKPITGGSISTIVIATVTPEVFGDENDINALLAADGNLFFGRFNTVIKMLGGPTRPIMISPMQDLGKPGAFALDSARLYQVEMGHSDVSRELIDGNQVGLLEDFKTKQPLAPDRIQVSLDRLLTDAISVLDGNVIWARDKFIQTTSVDSTELAMPFTIATSVGLNPITGFVVSGKTIYFGEASDDNVEKVSFRSDAEAGVPEVKIVAAKQPSPSQFAADDTNVYWRTGDCRIMKLAK